MHAVFFTWPMKCFQALGFAFVAYIALMYALHAKDYIVTPVYPAMLAAGSVAAERWFVNIWSRRFVVAYVTVACALSALMLPAVFQSSRSIPSRATRISPRTESRSNTNCTPPSPTTTAIVSDGRSASKPYRATTTLFPRKNDRRPRYLAVSTVKLAQSIASVPNWDCQGRSAVTTLTGTGGAEATPAKALSSWTATWNTCGSTAPRSRLLPIPRSSSRALIGNGPSTARNLDRNLSANWDVYRHFD